MSVIMFLKFNELRSISPIPAEDWSQAKSPANALFVQEETFAPSLSVCVSGSAHSVSAIISTGAEKKKWLWLTERKQRHCQALPPNDSALSAQRKQENYSEQLWPTTCF